MPLTELQIAQKPPLLISGDGRHTPILFLSRYLHAHSVTMLRKAVEQGTDFWWRPDEGAPPCSPPLAEIPRLVHISADVRISVPGGLDQLIVRE